MHFFKSNSEIELGWAELDAYEMATACTIHFAETMVVLPTIYTVNGTNTEREVWQIQSI